MLSRTLPGAVPAYPVGTVLALAAWAKREGPHRFGARIPDLLQSVEFAEVAASGKTKSYRRFAGTALAEDQSASSSLERPSLIRLDT